MRAGRDARGIMLDESGLNRRDKSCTIAQVESHNPLDEVGPPRRLQRAKLVESPFIEGR
jgi:hypothetical protein